MRKVFGEKNDPHRRRRKRGGTGSKTTLCGSAGGNPKGAWRKRERDWPKRKGLHFYGRRGGRTDGKKSDKMRRGELA